MTRIASHLRNPLTPHCIIMPQNKILRFNQWFLNIYIETFSFMRKDMRYEGRDIRPRCAAKTGMGNGEWARSAFVTRCCFPVIPNLFQDPPSVGNVESGE